MSGDAREQLVALLMLGRTAQQRDDLDQAITATPADPAEWRSTIPVRLYARRLGTHLAEQIPSIIAEQDKRPAEAVAQLLMNVFTYGIEVGRNWPETCECRSLSPGEPT